LLKGNHRQIIERSTAFTFSPARRPPEDERLPVQPEMMWAADVERKPLDSYVTLEGKAAFGAA
jgi:hypothetical protein